MSEILDTVIGVVIAIIFIVIGAIIVWTLAPINLFMAVVGIILLIALAVAVIVGFIRQT